MVLLTVTLSSLVVLFNAYYVESALRFANSYGDHMVLQQAPESAILWGYADTVGDTVNIVKNGIKVATILTVKNPNTGSSAAKWKIALPPESQHGPFSITAESSDGSVTLHDVMFGDVWICSGQSNMQFTMREVNNSAAEVEDSLSYPNIRMIYSKLVTAATPSEDVVVKHPWIKPTKGFIEGFSALCFLFGKELQKKYNYPIGLIESDWGGTRIEAWSSPDALAKCRNSGKKRAAPGPNDESALWNSMINPYLATTIKGAIWYQGESNAGNPSLYACSFPTMIADWRTKFNAESMGQTSSSFPFGFVQLAPFRPNTDTIQGFPPLRWAQTVNTGFVPNQQMPNTFMAVAIDLPDFNSPSGSIHPRYKQDIAVRLSLSAQAVAYGDTSVVFQGPYPSSYLMKGNRLQITFDDGHAALQVNNNDGFEICCSASSCQGNDVHWVKSTIMATMTSSIEIDASVCTSATQQPSGVRYLWRESPCVLKSCALYGQTNYLPVPPFVQVGPFNVTTGVPVGR